MVLNLLMYFAKHVSLHDGSAVHLLLLEGTFGLEDATHNQFLSIKNTQAEGSEDSGAFHTHALRT